MKLIHEPLPLRQRILLGIVGVIGTAAVMELLVRSHLIGGVGLPLPSSVARQAFHLVGDSNFDSQILYTLREWMLGLLIASVAGVLLGGLMGASKTVFEMFTLVVEVLRPLPAIAVGPLLVLILGTGMLPLSLTVALACLWPILFNAMYGVRAVDPLMIQTARTLHVPEAGLMSKVRLPAALPFMFTGIRVSASIGLIVAVSAELLIGSGSGIGGYILLVSANASDLDVVYAATLVTGVMGVLVSGVFALIDRYAFSWKRGLSQ